MEIRDHRDRIVVGRDLCPAQLFRRGTCSTGVGGQIHRQGGPRHASPDRGGTQGGQPHARSADARCHLRADALQQHRRSTQGPRRRSARVGAGQGRRALHGGAQPGVALAELAHRLARIPDVSGTRPARRHRLPVAGRHEWCARQESRVFCQRHSQRLARQGNSRQRSHAQRPGRRGAFSRRHELGGGPTPGGRSVCRPAGRGQPGGHGLQADGDHKARGCPPLPGRGAQAEHHDAAQPDQRTRRGRTRDPAARPGPHRGAVARRAGHGQGARHAGPHGNARNAPGRRIVRGPCGRIGCRPGAFRVGKIPGCFRSHGHRQEAGSGHWRKPHRRATGIRFAEQPSQGRPDDGRQGGPRDARHQPRQLPQAHGRVAV